MGISLTSNIAGHNSGNKSFLYGGKVQREKFTPNCQQNNRKKQSFILLKEKPQLLSLDHCYAKDPSEEVDFRKQVNIITENLKTRMDSNTAGSTSTYIEGWKEITSDKWILQTASRGVSL